MDRGKNKLPTIGTWGFKTGHNLIGPEMWKKNFPQGWFGKVIAHEMRYRSWVAVLRCYVPKRRKKEERHPHIFCEAKYFKEWKPNK